MEDIYFEYYKPGLPGTPDLEKASAHLPVRWAEYRATLKPRYSVVWRDIAFCYLLIFLGVAAVIFTQNFWGISWQGITAALILAIWIGYWLHSLSLFLHEAVHYNVHLDPQKNDFFANLLICPLLFLNVGSYRKIHWPHHLYLGETADTEKSYFNPLSPKFVLETLSGIHAMRTLFSYYRYRPVNRSEAIGWGNALQLFLIQASILGLLIVFGQYLAAGSWALGFGIFWPFLGAVRQLLRHRDENADPAIDYYKVAHGPILRMFGDDWFSKSFGHAGFNRHMLHHWDPHVSYTRLKDMEEYFKKTPLIHVIQTSRKNYWSFFKALLKKSKK